MNVKFPLDSLLYIIFVDKFYTLHVPRMSIFSLLYLSFHRIARAAQKLVWRELSIGSLDCCLVDDGRMDSTVFFFLQLIMLKSGPKQRKEVEKKREERNIFLRALHKFVELIKERRLDSLSNIMCVEREALFWEESKELFVEWRNMWEDDEKKKKRDERNGIIYHNQVFMAEAHTRVEKRKGLEKENNEFSLKTLVRLL